MNMYIFKYNMFILIFILQGRSNITISQKTKDFKAVSVYMSI